MEHAAADFFYTIADFNSAKAEDALRQGKIEIVETYFRKMIQAVENMIGSIIADNLSLENQARFRLLQARTKNCGNAEDIAELGNLWRLATGQPLRRPNRRLLRKLIEVHTPTILKQENISLDVVVDHSPFLTQTDRDLYYFLKGRRDTELEREKDDFYISQIISKAMNRAYITPTLDALNLPEAGNV